VKEYDNLSRGHHTSKSIRPINPSPSDRKVDKIRKPGISLDLKLAKPAIVVKKTKSKMADAKVKTVQTLNTNDLFTNEEEEDSYQSSISNDSNGEIKEIISPNLNTKKGKHLSAADIYGINLDDINSVSLMSQGEKRAMVERILLEAGAGMSLALLGSQNNGDKSIERTRQGIMKTIMTSQDFRAKQKAFHNAKRQQQPQGGIGKMTQFKPSNTTDSKQTDLESSDGSALGRSLYDEIEQELVQESSELKRSNAIDLTGKFNPIKLPNNFIPIKVSFKIGVAGSVNPTAVQVKKERIYRRFAIKELHWYLVDKSLVGLKVFLQHKREKYFLEGEVHGIKTSTVVPFVFDENESMNTLHFQSDTNEVHWIKIVTDTDREFIVGKSQNEVLKLDLGNPTIRYFPKEIKLFKVFSSFNNVTRKLSEIRFLYVKTVFYS